MEAQERIENTLTLAVSRMQEEVTGLLGADFLLTNDNHSFIGKDKFFEQATGKQVVAKVSLSGDLEGTGCLMADINDAIRLGGTLIMLPPSELEEFIGREDYSEDVADAFGEIANILCGALSKAFEENYPKACRLVRQEQAIIKPGKVDIASAEPFPDQRYYQLRAAMSLAGAEMGNLFILLPAEPFGLDASAETQATVSQTEATPADTAASQTREEGLEKSQGKTTAAETVPESAASAQAPEAAPAPPATNATANAEKEAKEWQDWKDRFDTSLTDASQTLQVEFASLLGADVQFGAPENRLVTKEEFFHQECDTPQLMADMEIAGDMNGLAYLFCSLQDAIHLGGTLIMLPPSELEVVVAENDLTPDAEDAYGEIVNIIAEVYGDVFESLAKKKFHLDKRGLQKVLSLDVEVAGDTPIPDTLYYQSALSMSVEGKQLGKLRLLLPADLLELRPPVTIATAQPETARRQATPGQQPQPGSIATPPLAAGRTDGAIEALVISDDETQAERIAAVIAQAGMTAKKIGFKDNLYAWLPGQVRVIFVVMREIDEQAFGIVIKVSACPLPLVAVAPGWTRSRVIKAARYGVSDILASPASEAVIGESLHNNLTAS